MLDVVATLAAGNGIVSRCVVQPPPGPQQPLWTVAVELTGGPRNPDPARGRPDFSLHVVGACGTNRTDTMVRAAGEAVERFALIPRRECSPVPVRSTAADLGERALPFVEACLGAAAAAGVELDWYPGTRLSDGSDVLVPAPLVDYPTIGGAAELFDPSPSGAASASGRAAALRAALLEIVERDAVLVAWARQERLDAVDPDALDLDAADRGSGPGAADPVAGELRRLLRRCAELGLRPVCGLVPSAVPGVTTVVCVLQDPTAPGHHLVSAGSKASTDGAAAMLGALRESLQIRGLLLDLRRHDAGRVSPSTGVVDGDLARARHLTTPAGADALWAWARGFRPRPWCPERSPAERLPVGAIVDALVADGAGPVAVDLTARIPSPLRRHGWAAVKVVAPGYQPLRMDERHRFGWLRRRIGREPTRLPHPLV